MYDQYHYGYGSYMRLISLRADIQSNRNYDEDKAVERVGLIYNDEYRSDTTKHYMITIYMHGGER